MTITLSGLPALSVLQVPAGRADGMGFKWRCVGELGLWCGSREAEHAPARWQAHACPSLLHASARTPRARAHAPDRLSAHWIWKHWPQPFSSSDLKNELDGDRAAAEK